MIRWARTMLCIIAHTQGYNNRRYKQQQYRVGKLPVQGAYVLRNDCSQKWYSICVLTCMCPSRLETRTKESSAYASSVIAKASSKMNVIAARRCLAAFCKNHAGLCKSECVRIRKIVNYANEVRSLKKFSWMPIAILTCKSFVVHWCWGERLIELSSSWFPSKFPSG